MDRSIRPSSAVAVRVACVLAGAWFAWGSAPAAAQVRVDFDAPYLAAAEPLPQPDFGSAYVGEKWVAVRLEISSLVHSGDERDLRHTLVHVSAPQRTLLVQDWFPKSVQAASVTGAIVTQRQRESAHNTNFNLSGAHAPLSGGWQSSSAGKEHTDERFERLPPLETVLASGPTDRGSGAFFKFRAGERQRLEGSHEITLHLRAPQGWRCDYLLVRCSAGARNRSVVRGLDADEVEAGARRFLLPVYLAGDPAARRAAEQLSRAESQLRLEVRRQADQIAGRTYPSVIHKLGVWPEARPEIPLDWLSRLLYDPPPLRDSAADVPERLPPGVRRAALDLIAARAEVRQLSGWE